MKIVSVKLITNEELIGVLDSEDIGSLNIHEPYLINYVYNSEYGQGMRLTPFMPCVKDRLFTLLSKHVILKADVDSTSEEYYLKCLEQSANLKDTDTDTVDLNYLDSSLTRH